VIRDVQLGSLLIQSDPKTGEPLLFYSSFPDCIKDQSRSNNAIVFLLDSQVGTGAAALMAVRVLLDHGVQGKFSRARHLCLLTETHEITWPTEQNIILLTFLVARQGLLTIRRAFPGVRVVTAAVDPVLTERAFPMDEHTVVGTAAGDADFAARIAPFTETMQGGDGNIHALEARIEQLRFSRSSQAPTPRESRQKRAWVIEPGAWECYFVLGVAGCC
jgi:uridine kinase